ncbi:hypothetical protein KCU89_g11, partial [Aureobasidium melanogenum]
MDDCVGETPTCPSSRCHVATRYYGPIVLICQRRLFQDESRDIQSQSEKFRDTIGRLISLVVTDTREVMMYGRDWNNLPDGASVQKSRNGVHGWLKMRMQGDFQHSFRRQVNLSLGRVCVVNMHGGTTSHTSDKHEQILSHQTVSSRVSHSNAQKSTLTGDEDQEQSKVTHEVDSQQSIIPTQTSHKP